MPSESIAFDRAAEFYDETRGFPPGEDLHVASMIARTSNLTSELAVLEVGVGTGRIAVPLSAHVGHYVGIDLAMPMMNKMKQKSGSERVQPVQGDVTRLPFPSGHFDAVVATHVFHLIPAWETALQETARILKPGGKLLNCYGNNAGHAVMRSLWNLWDETIPEEKRRPVGANFQIEPDFLQKAGWQLEAQGSYEYQSTVTVARFVDLLRRRVWSRLWIMDQDDIDLGVAAVEKYIAENIENPEEPQVLTNSVIADVFTKST